MTKRMGRPPKVKEDRGDLVVAVDGTTYRFREGSDGHVRALGLPDRGGTNFAYAKKLVGDYITSQEDIAQLQ